VDLRTGTVCYDITVTGIGVAIEPAAGIGNAHIHSRAQDGGIAVDLETEFTAVAGVAETYQAIGCGTAPRRVLVDILLHPEQYYVNDAYRRLPVVQDWGGPIGFWTATRHPDWFRAFVIGNTWAWPLRDDRSIEWFSKILGSRRLGGVLVRQGDVFVNLFMKGGMRRKKLSIDEQFMYRRPHPTPESREPVHVLPREILAADNFLAEVKQGLGRVADKPALIVWGPKDPGFKERHRVRWEGIFRNHRTVILPGAAQYIQEDAPEEIVRCNQRLVAWNRLVIINRGA
jgi:hypothetical protein